jgi:hypothetical protein
MMASQSHNSARALYVQREPAGVGDHRWCFHRAARRSPPAAVSGHGSDGRQSPFRACG